MTPRLWNDLKKLSYLMVSCVMFGCVLASIIGGGQPILEDVYKPLSAIVLLMVAVTIYLELVRISTNRRRIKFFASHFGYHMKFFDRTVSDPSGKKATLVCLSFGDVEADVELWLDKGFSEVLARDLLERLAKQNLTDFGSNVVRMTGGPSLQEAINKHIKQKD